MAIPMKLCKTSKNVFDSGRGQAQTPYYVTVQYGMKSGHTYTISSNVPYAVPSNLYGIDYNNNFQRFEVYEGHPVTLTMGENYVGLFYPYLEQPAQEGTCVDVSSGLDDGTYWVQVEEGTEATAYEAPGITEETYDGRICGGKFAPTISSDQCNGAYFIGTDDITIKQGVDIDLERGVHAFDSDGNELEFTYTPTSIDKCAVGKHTVTYRTKAIGSVSRPYVPCGKSFLTMSNSCGDMNVFTENRIVTITQAKPPKISGIGAVTVAKNTDFNPLSGVSAVDDNGNSVDVEYSGEYTQIASGAIAEFDTDLARNVKSLTANIAPTQDLHGYDHPWAGGGGKNLLENTATTTTKQGLTYMVNSDGSVTVNGTATANSYLNINCDITRTEAVIVSGTPTPVQSGVYIQTVAGGTNYNDTSGTGQTIPANTQITEVRLRVNSGVTVSNKTFYPMIRLASVSDATFEPYSNICPITGTDSVTVTRTGRNLLPLRASGSTQTNNGLTSTWLPDGTIRISGTATVNTVILASASNTEGNKLHLPSGTYIVSGMKDLADPNITFVGVNINSTSGNYDASSNGTSTSNTFTVAEGDYVYVRLRIPNGKTLNNYICKPMIRLASDTDPTFEPYTGSSYPTSLGRTVYGGTLDMVSGVLTVDKAFITMLGTSGTQTAGTKMNKGSATTANIFYTFNSNNGLYPSVLTDTSDLVCSHFPTGLASSTTEAQCYMGSAQFRICLPLDNSLGISTADEMNAWLAEQYNNGTPVQFAVKLLTPQTYQLTPTEVETLVGSNVVWSDAESVTVEYWLTMPEGTIQFASDGKYTITYTAEDECGNETEQARTVTVA